jgi:TolB-like protein/Flp pilus assembly protein TadD
MSESGSAVFLSYASQDAAAAKRICDALRAAGVEVWFDQNELVGGDAWDAKIRGQIGSCALFVPIISANTQARLEGYFRLEWKIAAQRTHTMADERVFLLPVVIDATRDAEARVPAEFKSVQWTRLAEGETTPAFCARVRRLLESGGVVERTASAEAPARGPAAPASASERKYSWMGYAWAAVGIGFGLFYALRPMWMPKREPAPKPAPAAVAAAPISEAQRLVAKAREILEQGDELNRENYALAEELLKRAESLDVTEASAWSLHAWLSADLYRYGLDRTEARLAQIQAQASRAVSLAPNTLDAQLAMLRSQTATRAAPEEIAQRQAELAERHPDDPRVYRLFGLSHAKDSVTFKMLERGLARWPDDARLQGDMLNSLLLGGRFVEANELAEKFSRGRTGARVLAVQVFLQLWWQGDVAAASASVARWPSWLLLEDRGAGMAAITALMARTPEATIDVLRRFPRDYIRDSFYTGPRSALIAWACEAAGQSESALAEWRVVLQVCERELAAVPNDGAALHWKAWALARLGQKAEAQQIFRVLLQRRAAIEGSAQVTGGLAGLALVLGDPEEALRELGRLGSYDPMRTRPPSRALFDLNPLFDPLRRDPRFQALRDAAPAPAAPVAAAPAVDEKSVAVLAFANLSDEKANEYFSDGISEELLNVLAKVGGLKVTARTSAFYFKGKNTPIPEIARTLGVAYVVEGSVRRAGDKVRITAQLVKAADGFRVWSDTFTRDVKDVFAVQDEIAGLIAKNISPKLTQTAVATTARQVDPEAFQLYLEGRALARKAGVNDLQQAIALFDRALQRDPGFALARAQQARAYVQLGRWGGIVPKEAWAAAKAALAPALAAEPDTPEVLVAQGWILRTADWKWREAETAFARALELRPSDTDMLVSAAVLKAGIGKSAEAHVLAQRAVELDPLNPATQFDLGLIYRFSDRLPEAERQFRRAIELSPGGQRYRTFLALVVVALGRFDEAEELARNEPDVLSKLFVQGLAAAGRRDQKRLQETIAELEAKRPTLGRLGDYSAYLSSMRAAAGDLDGAMAELEITRESRDPSIGWIKVNYLVRPLHAHPRWPEFLRSLGLADDQLR